MSEAPAPDQLDALAAHLLDLAAARRERIATAESCTGGLLSALLTDVEGLSHGFERGFVVYDERAKVEMLGMDEGRIAEEGPVSEWAAKAMAEGALARSRATLAIAITGFAGPGQPDEEEGLVHLAVSRQAADGVSTEHRKAHYGACGRADVRAHAVQSVIEMAVSMLKA